MRYDALIKVKKNRYLALKPSEYLNNVFWINFKIPVYMLRPNELTETKFLIW